MSAGAPLPPALPDLGQRTQRYVDAVDRAVLWLASHWVYGLLALAALMTLLPVAAPLLLASGHAWLAQAIYLPFRLICHQRSERSFHLAGEQMAVCERDCAIYASVCVLLGLYALLGRRIIVPVLRLRWAVLLALPMALDGGTQLIGLRESTWELRVVTGALFACGATWFVLPLLAEGFQDMRAATAARFNDPDAAPSTTTDMGLSHA